MKLITNGSYFISIPNIDCSLFVSFDPDKVPGRVSHFHCEVGAADYSGELN